MVRLIWLAAVSLVLFAAMFSAIALLHRRATQLTASHDKVMHRARQAMHGMGRDRKRSEKGTIRGKGGDGNVKTMLDAAYGSDTSAGA